MNKEDRKNKGKAVMMDQQVRKAEPKFPEGIRVLVVDDNETCLFWVENLLLNCNFKATTTLYAREAIEMLRMNKDQFDLVITDVQMPEMNGFQLLELIGLEMDLPVIMMSIYSHQKFIDKGVKHGAVDYLVKPVTLEKIQNVWKHVLRKRNTLFKEIREADRSNSIQCGVNGALADTGCNAGETSSKRPSDQPDDDSEEDDENGHENEGKTTRRRPRVVWNLFLQQKFIAAVNRLGIDKAVPKKILKVMDVDTGITLTRQNIASHLQKYRMHLKKLAKKNASENTTEGLGGRNSFVPMNYVGGSRYTPNHGGLLGGQLNFGGISSSDLIQSSQNLQNYISPHIRLQPNNGLPSLPNGNSLQGMAGRFQQDPTQAGKTLSHLSNYNQGHDAYWYGVSGNFLDPRIGGNAGLSSAEFVDHVGFSDGWKPAAQNFQSSFQMSGAFTQNQLRINGNTSNGNHQQLMGFPQLSTVPRESSIIGQNVNFPSTQGWADNNEIDYIPDMNSLFESPNPIMAPNGTMRSLEISDQNSLFDIGNSSMGPVHGTVSQTMGQQTDIAEQTNLPQDDFILNNIESMDDIMNSIIAAENNGQSSMFMNGEFDFDAFDPSPSL